jgi:acyl-CoA thioester hydrolase
MTASEQPPVVHRAVIEPGWIDRNGHFNAGYYMVVFDDATGHWLGYCGLTTAHREAYRVTTFSVESHILYLRELREGDEVCVTGQLLAFTDRKIHSFLRMFHAKEGYLAATNEVMTLHIGLPARRPAAMHPRVEARLAEVREAQAHLAHPPQAGRVISVHSGRPTDR